MLVFIFNLVKSSSIGSIIANNIAVMAAIVDDRIIVSMAIAIDIIDIAASCCYCCSRSSSCARCTTMFTVTLTSLERR